MKLRTYIFAVVMLVAAQNAAADSWYDLGYNLSSTSVDSAWQNFDGDCFHVDSMMEIVSDSVETANEVIADASSSGVERFGDGYINGLMISVAKIATACTSKCIEVGRAAAKVASKVFCKISEKIGRTARFSGMKSTPNIGCGIPYVQNCESSFVKQSKNYCPTYASGDTFDDYYRARSNGCCAYATHR